MRGKNRIIIYTDLYRSWNNKNNNNRNKQKNSDSLAETSLRIIFIYVYNVYAYKKIRCSIYFYYITDTRNVISKKKIHINYKYVHMTCILYTFV